MQSWRLPEVAGTFIFDALVDVPVLDVDSYCDDVG